ncbi:alpha-ketoacid dehydrogenase subunit beta [Nosocomiicoccus sp. HMSC09A07]|uniref:alpha-ketoacid dehydrogenase subunit beta n=1 Tax=Nosocomiicoccus sp. HMSC09A07 TaxID=1581145 RepID=UPI0008A22537|nr:alpha-ketoacid dehydrogenase subunit beta [Nosocomiicoccus sp. HMSC09A07]OFS64214.1 2-oxoisovalerate dehydrogenase [Nosocomiicoccus sp. HMSC09A07]
MTKTMTLLEAIHDGLDYEMGKDENVFVLGEDVGQKGGVFKVTAGLQERYGKMRVLDTPLAESLIVGTAIGASLAGKRPVAEIQFAEYILPATNQIMSEAAKIRYRSNNGWHCPIVIRAPFGGGIHGALYHSQSIESVFSSTPGLKVVIPSTPSDAKGLLISAIRDNDPVLFFEHKKAYRLLKEDVPTGEHVVPIGKADIKREGKDITVITYGLCVHMAIEAAERLENDGYSAKVVDLRTIYPLDQETIIESVKDTSKVLLVTEDNLEGSVMSEVSAIISEHAFYDLDAPVMRLAAPNVPAMPYAPPMEDYFMVNPDKIYEKMKELAEH